VAWLQQHGALLGSPPGYAGLAAEAARLVSEPRLEKDASYWPTIVRLAAVGQLTGAAELLLLHPVYRQQQQQQQRAGGNTQVGTAGGREAATGREGRWNGLREGWREQGVQGWQGHSRRRGKDEGRAAESKQLVS
jgi:hypothetical protein